ncbi:hypothetical protein FRC18_004346 [Serendipita sp. 400]|nr:hypothetical protein FRC18_004346 [Serendipita sp. 400]
MQRSDWGTFSISGMESGGTVPDQMETTPETGTKFMERFGSGRLGAIMKDLEGRAEDLRLPSLPTMPTMPAMPAMPTMPTMPTMPAMPTIATRPFGLGGKGDQ